MLIRLLVWLCEISPRLRRLLWRWWYGKLARQFAGEDGWTFMNYGFIPPDGVALPLEPADEPSRLCIQLYRRTVSSVDLTGARVLEVGSGRGGGASYLARYFKPAQVTGADFAPAAVALCQRRHQGVARLGFAVGNAERLPFADASFDVVINVESSHCYGHVDRFFSEVARVLRPGGTFLYTDFRPVAGMAEVEGQLTAVPDWKLIESEDLTGGVAAALEADDARKRKLITDAVPPRLQHLFGEFAGLVGGEMHEGFSKRTMVYRRFALRKK